MFQGEKGEPGVVFGPDGRVLAPAQKGAKVRQLPGVSPLVQAGEGGGGRRGFQEPWRQHGELSSWEGPAHAMHRSLS